MTSSSSRSVSHALYSSFTSTDIPIAAKLEQTVLLPSRMLSPHSRYYVREMRILAYNQLLQSYRSLTLDSMARSFGVGIEFIDTCVAPLSFFVCGLLADGDAGSSRGSSRRAACTARSTRSRVSSRRTGPRSRTRNTRRSCARVIFC